MISRRSKIAFRHSVKRPTDFPSHNSSITRLFRVPNARGVREITVSYPGCS